MNNIEIGSVKHLVILIIAIAIAGMILYPLFDLVLCKWMTHSAFVYSVHSYVVQPISFAVITGICIWLVEKKSK